jgi:hypothetical protein
VLLPPSAADTIFNCPDFTMPLMFEIRTKKGQRVYCGLLEFTAPEGTSNLLKFLTQFRKLYHSRVVDQNLVH